MLKSLHIIRTLLSDSTCCSPACSSLGSYWRGDVRSGLICSDLQSWPFFSLHTHCNNVGCLQHGHIPSFLPFHNNTHTHTHTQRERERERAIFPHQAFDSVRSPRHTITQDSPKPCRQLIDSLLFVKLWHLDNIYDHQNNQCCQWWRRVN